jgi:hypothetical protein
VLYFIVIKHFNQNNLSQYLQFHQSFYLAENFQSLTPVEVAVSCRTSPVSALYLAESNQKVTGQFEVYVGLGDGIPSGNGCVGVLPD